MVLTQVLFSSQRRRVRLVLIVATLCALPPFLMFIREDFSELHYNTGKCPIYPSYLRGALSIAPRMEMEQLEQELDWVSDGGCWHPSECEFRQEVTIIIAFRDRHEHLPRLLHQLHKMLRSQQVKYCVFVISQNWDDKPFNRGMLFNVGFDITKKTLNNLSNDLANYKDYNEFSVGDDDAILNGAKRDFGSDCIILHDVDLIPLNDHNLYNCTAGMPKHLSVAVDVFNYHLPYPTSFGGVTSLTLKDFEDVNGYSNLFWGWGGEDDDMWNRIEWANLSVFRDFNEISSYKMLRHNRSRKNGHRFERVNDGKHYFQTDGLNNLKYKVLNKDIKKLYTNITVDLEVVRPENMIAKPKSWTWTLLKSIANF